MRVEPHIRPPWDRRARLPESAMGRERTVTSPPRGDQGQPRTYSQAFEYATQNQAGASVVEAWPLPPCLLVFISCDAFVDRDGGSAADESDDEHKHQWPTPRRSMRVQIVRIAASKVFNRSASSRPICPNPLCEVRSRPRTLPNIRTRMGTCLPGHSGKNAIRDNIVSGRRVSRIYRTFCINPVEN